MRIRKFRRGCLALAVLLLTMAGCDGVEPALVRSAGPHDSAPMPKLAEGADFKTFGILYPMAHPFYEMVTEQIEEASKPYPIQLTVKAPAEASVEQQILMMENMIKQHVDGIAISPVDPEAVKPLVDKAVEAGIPVICFETDIPGSKRASFIGSDAHKEGALMGSIISQQLGGKGMILIQGGRSGSPREGFRLEGMLDYLKQNSTIQILDIRYNEGQNDTALSNLERMIDDHPHFDALVSLDIISSSTSILVWKAQGLRRTAVAFGLTPDAREALVNGQINSVISDNEYLLGSSIIQQLLLASSGSSSSAWVDTGIKELNRSNVPEH